MKSIIQLAGIFLFIFLFSTTGCEKEPEPAPEPTTGVLKGLVTDIATTMAIEDAKIFIYNANTNAPTGDVLTTDASGNYEIELNPGDYFVRASKQGYYDAPPSSVPGLSFTVVKGDSIVKPVEMYANGLTNIGWISGTVSPMSAANSSVLVVASNGTEGYSAVVDADGNYTIFNVPAGSYVVKAWGAGFSSDSTTAVAVNNVATTNVDLNLTAGSAGTVSGSITFLATQNIEVDVSLTHPVTGEAIPGLTAMTSSQSYTIADVADGTYLARASFMNDEKVMDPDWIIKNGEPYVTVSGGSATRDFSITGAIGLSSPTNASTTTLPTQISTTTPTFTWNAYSSTSDYIVEVTDANGQLIWGGFSSNWTVRNLIIPSSSTSVVFNFDNNATANLVAGKIYRWRVYASKDVSGGASWELISSSEDQMGLFEIVL